MDQSPQLNADTDQPPEGGALTTGAETLMQTVPNALVASGCPVPIEACPAPTSAAAMFPGFRPALLPGPASRLLSGAAEARSLAASEDDVDPAQPDELVPRRQGAG